MPIDLKKYGDDWRDTVRPRILNRDNYKCVKCGAKQRAKGYRDEKKVFIECDEFLMDWCKRNSIKVITIFLSVSHKNHDVTDMRDENLWSLCQRCHIIHDKHLHSHNRIMNRGKKAHQLLAQFPPHTR
jgi:5-methylcytosine-specific restriction endonuclease McrA